MKNNAVNGNCILEVTQYYKLRLWSQIWVKVLQTLVYLLLHLGNNCVQITSVGHLVTHIHISLSSGVSDGKKVIFSFKLFFFRILY